VAQPAERSLVGLRAVAIALRCNAAGIVIHWVLHYYRSMQPSCRVCDLTNIAPHSARANNEDILRCGFVGAYHHMPLPGGFNIYRWNIRPAFFLSLLQRWRCCDSPRVCIVWTSGSLHVSGAHSTRYNARFLDLPRRYRSHRFSFPPLRRTLLPLPRFRRLRSDITSDAYDFSSCSLYYDSEQPLSRFHWFVRIFVLSRFGSRNSCRTT